MGRGFGEAVGYVHPTRNAIALAGIPVTDPMISLFTQQPPFPLMKLLSFLYLLLPSKKNELKKILACASMPPGPRPFDCG